MIGKTVRFLCLLLIATPLYGEIAGVAYFSPDQVSAGMPARLILEIPDMTTRTPLDLPKVPGLEIRNPRIQTSLQVVNGKRSVRSVHIYQVATRNPGTYTLPSFTLSLNRENVHFPEAALEVLEQDKNIPVTPNDSLRLLLEIPRETLYVGETIPVKVHLYARQDIQGSFQPPGYPQMEGDAFTGNNAPRDALKTHGVFGGVWYNKVSWEYAITPFKQGTHTLSFDFGLNVEQRESPPSGIPGMPSLFGSMMTRTEPIQLSTETHEIHVAPLPSEGKPDDFSGAIGTFAVKQSSSVKGTDPRVGEPITLTVTVTGAGNFDRIQAPSLSGIERWKTYPPQVRFDTQDVLGYEGSKIFEYIIIPQEAGEQALPQIRFSFYDPEAESYRTFSSKWPAVEVAPALIQPYAFGAPSDSQPNPSASTVTPKPHGLLPNHLSLGPWYTHYVPIFWKPSFWALQGVIALLIGGAFFFLKRQSRLSQDPEHLRLKASESRLKKLRIDLDKAVQKNDMQAFAEAAQAILRAYLVRMRGESALTYTWEELASLLDELGASDALQQEAQSFFELSNAIRFGGQHSVAPLKELSEKLNLIQKELEAL